MREGACHLLICNPSMSYGVGARDVGPQIACPDGLVELLRAGRRDPRPGVVSEDDLSGQEGR